MAGQDWSQKWNRNENKHEHIKGKHRKAGVDNMKRINWTELKFEHSLT